MQPIPTEDLLAANPHIDAVELARFAETLAELSRLGVGRECYRLLPPFSSAPAAGERHRKIWGRTPDTPAAGG